MGMLIIIIKVSSIRVKGQIGFRHKEGDHDTDREKRRESGEIERGSGRDSEREKERDSDSVGERECGRKRER